MVTSQVPGTPPLLVFPKKIVLVFCQQEGRLVLVSFVGSVVTRMEEGGGKIIIGRRPWREPISTHCPAKAYLTYAGKLSFSTETSLLISDLYYLLLSANQALAGFPERQIFLKKIFTTGILYFQTSPQAMSQ